MKSLSKITKSIVAALLLFCPFTQIIADERTPEEMLSIAESVFKTRIQKERARLGSEEKTPRLLDVTVKSSEIINGIDKERETFQIFTFTNGAPGYVIVSADDRLPEVIGFSDKQHFIKSDIPTALQEMLTGYSEALYYSDEEVTLLPKYTTAKSTSVEPLLGEISYNQSEPYNDMCPMHNGKKSVAGCLATAICEIVAYHRHPAKMSGSVISYNTNTYSLPVRWDCANTVFDWDNILDKYSGRTPEFSGTIKTSIMQMLVAGDVKLSDSYYGNIEISKFVNLTSGTLAFKAYTILADSKGNFIRPLNSGTDGKLDYGYMYTNFYIPHSMPSDIEDGEYRIYIGAKKDNASTWSIVRKASDPNNLLGSRVNVYLKVVKKGNTYTINNQTFDCSYTKEQGDAIATLCGACGAISKMDYTSAESGAYQHEGMTGLYKYMDYDDAMTMVSAPYFTDEEWHSLLQEELHYLRPILCCGQTKEGAGHAYVIDGYKYVDGVPYYHINWGWGGVSDGYFTITDMTPSASGTGGQVANYGYSSEMTINIMPKDDKNDGAAFSAEEIILNRTKVNTSGFVGITVNNIYNRSPRIFTGKLVAYAIDSNNNEYKIGTYQTLSGLNILYGYQALQANVKIPTTIPTGDYRIELRSATTTGKAERTVMSASRPSIHITNPTAIENIEAESSEAEIFDLSGRKINESVKNGIYIKQGKKYIAR